MHHHRRWLSRVVGVVAVVGSLIVGSIGTARATTGPTYILPGSKYRVRSQVEALYIGQYKLASVDRHARLSGGAMGIEVNDSGYLYGVGQFYGYDQSGYQSTWTATLYNFHQTGKNAMVFDLLGRTGSVVLGHLSVIRAATGNLTGQITLSTGHFNIQWQKIAGR